MSKKRKQQQSKRSRKARKQAKHAGLPKNTGHPSHQSGTRRWNRIDRDQRPPTWRQ